MIESYSIHTKRFPDGIPYCKDCTSQSINEGHSHPIIKILPYLPEIGEDICECCNEFLK